MSLAMKRNTYFHTFFHPHVFSKKLKTVVQTHLPKGPQVFAGPIV